MITFNRKPQTDIIIINATGYENLIIKYAVLQGLWETLNEGLPVQVVTKEEMGSVKHAIGLALEDLTKVIENEVQLQQLAKLKKDANLD